MSLQFWERLDELMGEKGLTNVKLGEAIGLSASIIARWKRKKTSIRSENLVKLAAFFDCSLDFMAGRTAYVGHAPEKKTADFKDVIKRLTDDNSIVKVSENTGISRVQFYAWFKGVPPKLQSLLILAEYYNQTIDFLLGYE